MRHPPSAYPGYSALQAQGLFDSDLSCPESLIAGKCALPMGRGVLLCTGLPTCRTVVILVHGGCYARLGCRPPALAALMATRQGLRAAALLGPAACAAQAWPAGAQ